MFIDSQAQLDAFCAGLADAPRIATDTEFARTNTFAPRLCLVQAAVGDQIGCIDTLNGLDMSALWAALFRADTQKIFHAAKQDFEVLLVTADGVPGNLLDTQIAAGLAGFPAQIGYANLARETIGVDIPKGATRTDWSRRPLSQEQLTYAADDVRWLEQVADEVLAKLEALNRMAWLEEDCAALCDPDLYAYDPGQAWQRVKAIASLPAPEQSRVRVLAEWREQRAIDADRPRQWILDDKTLVAIAQANPASKDQLKRRTEISDGLLRKQGDRLLQLVKDANRRHTDGEFPVLDAPKRPDERETALTKKLLAMLREAAGDLGLEPEVLGSRKDVVRMVNRKPSRLSAGWRYGVIGEALERAVD